MNKTSYMFGCLGLIALFGLIGFFWAKSTYNGMVDQEVAVEQQWAQVRNVYQRRMDLIPNLVETVKGAANFEKGTLTEIADARSRIGQLNVNENTFKDPKALDNFLASQDKLNGAIGRLMAQVENYPDLKATQNFQSLSVSLEGSENRIAVERKKFNEAAGVYNTTIRRFPANLFAGIFGFEKIDFYEGDKGNEKAPTVKF